MNLKSIAKLEAAKWAIHNNAFGAVQLAFEALANSSLDTPSEFAFPDDLVIIGNVGIISVDGILAQHVSELEAFLGFTDVENIQDALERCEESPLVDKVILYFNSPGGTVGGIAATAELVKSATKPVYAFSDSICASAAYWIASNANSGVYGTEDADFGSIGVYSFITSPFAYAEKEGFAPTLIKSGKYKAIGIAPVSDDERAVLQSENDKIYEAFKASVSANRPIADDDMQGLTYYGQDAVDKGFVDGFVSSIDELIAHLQG